MERIGVGVVGCGFVGMGAHVPAFHSIDSAQLVAIADADPARREKVGRKYGVQALYPDYAELVNDPAVQVVVVAAPTPLHAKVTLAAIEAGKHVLCEMPLASNLDEVERMIDAARRQGVCLMPSLNFHFTPNYAKAKEIIDNGQLGNLSAIMYREWIPAQDLAKQWPPGSWMWNIEESGGPLFTLSVWSIDLVRWLTGSEIVGVQHATRYTRLDKTGGTLGYDAFAAIQLQSGVVGQLQFSGSVCHAATTSALEVVGDSTHVLTATGNDTITLLGEDPAKTVWDVKERGAKMWGHQQQDEYFIQCLRDGRNPHITPEDGRKAMEIAWQIAKAS